MRMSCCHKNFRQPSLFCFIFEVNQRTLTSSFSSSWILRSSSWNKIYTANGWKQRTSLTETKMYAAYESYGIFNLAVTCLWQNKKRFAYEWPWPCINVGNTCAVPLYFFFFLLSEHMISRWRICFIDGTLKRTHHVLQFALVVLDLQSQAHDFIFLDPQLLEEIYMKE